MRRTHGDADPALVSCVLLLLLLPLLLLSLLLPLLLCYEYSTSDEFAFSLKSERKCQTA